MKGTPSSAPPEDINPYAPPSAADILPPEEKYPWYTAARAVFVRNGTELPPVDLCGGEQSATLVRTTRTLTKHKPSATFLTIALFAPIGFFTNRLIGDWQVFLLILFLSSYLVRFILHFIFPDFWMKRARFAFHCTPSLERFRKGTLVTNALAAAACFTPAFFVPYSEFRILALVAGLLVFKGYGVLLKKLALKRYPLEMHFSEGQPGWIRLAGVHRDALRQLNEIEAAREP